MSRIQVTALTTPSSLELEGSDWTLADGDIVSVGNSIGGYLAHPIIGTGGSQWGFWRLSGPQKKELNELLFEDPWAFEEHIAHIVGSIPEGVVRGGRQYLLATSSGAARNGIVHSYRPPSAERDPIKRVLRELGIGLSVLDCIVTDTIHTTERWYDQHHCPNGRPTHWWVTDGVVHVMDEEQAEEPRGYFAGGGWRSGFVEGGTYAIRVDYRRAMNGSGVVSISRVLVREGCNPEDLKEAISKILG